MSSPTSILWACLLKYSPKSVLVSFPCWNDCSSLSVQSIFRPSSHNHLKNINQVMLFLGVNPPPVVSHWPGNAIELLPRAWGPCSLLLPFRWLSTFLACQPPGLSVVSLVGHHSPPGGLCSSTSLGWMCLVPSFALIPCSFWSFRCQSK